MLDTAEQAAFFLRQGLRMTIVVAGAIWTGLIALLIFRWRSPADRSTTYLGMAVGFGLLLNIDPVYLIADGWLGGHNFADLLANTAIIVGVSSFARGVAKAADGSPPIAKVILGPYVLLVVVAVSTASFSMIETTGSSTLFMVDYGGQPAAAVYSGSQHLYFGLVTLAMAVVCIGQLTNVRGFMLVSTIVLLIGSIGQTLTCVDVIFMDVSHVLGNASLLRFGQSFYDYSNGLSIVLLAAGFAMLPGARFFDARRTRARIARMVEELGPAWSRALNARASGPTVEPSGDQEAILHRQLVEIRDAQASLGGEYDLSPAEISRLETAEAFLLGGSSAAPRHEG
jgi:hypothetical protein